jgi:predicted ATP-dependent endonuclease of OLD family
MNLNLKEKTVRFLILLVLARNKKLPSTIQLLLKKNGHLNNKTYTIDEPEANLHPQMDN